MKVVGKDKHKVKRVTCSECTSIIEYEAREVKTRSYTVMGDLSGDSYIKCPTCKAVVVIPGSAW